MRLSALWQALRSLWLHWVARHLSASSSGSSERAESPDGPASAEPSTVADAVGPSTPTTTATSTGPVPERAVEGHPVWTEIAPELTPRDFRHPWEMCPAFLRRLSRARRACGVPFRVVSDYRPPDRNASAGGASQSAHLESPCRAVDLRVLDNHERYRVVTALLAEGFERLGVYAPTEWQRSQYGTASGSVHVDASPTNPSPRIWMSWQ